MDTTDPKPVSINQVRIFAHLEDVPGWQTITEIANATGLTHRTCARHVQVLVAAGVLTEDRVTFPSHYRFHPLPRGNGYLERLRHAHDLFLAAGKLPPPRKKPGPR